MLKLSDRLLKLMSGDELKIIGSSGSLEITWGVFLNGFLDAGDDDA